MTNSKINLYFLEKTKIYKKLNFKIIENGDHVICAVSGKKISLDNLNYWNVETQEAYYSYKEAHQKRESET